MVVETMREEHLSCREIAKQFEIPHQRACSWERIYLTEGPELLHIERRGRGSKGRPAKLPKEVEDNLLAENQRLRAELAYLKNASFSFGGRATPKQKATVIQELRREHNLTMLLEIAQLPRSTFYILLSLQTERQRG